MKFLLVLSSQIAIGRLNRMSGSGDMDDNFFGFSVSDKPWRLLTLKPIKFLINKGLGY